MSEYIVERMVAAGADKICFVIAPGKSDILEYFGGKIGGADVCYVVQPTPAGLCDAIFRALPVIGAGDEALIGLPDTVWFPVDALARAPREGLTFILFPVDHPELFDAVRTDERGAVRGIDVKSPGAASRWVWGAIRASGGELATLRDLWHERGERDAYFGTLVNAYLARGGSARALAVGEAYVDVGTLHGYRAAIQLLAARAEEKSRKGI